MMKQVYKILLIVFVSLVAVAEEETQDKIPTGDCKQLDSYIFYCKVFHCSMKLVASPGYKNSFEAKVLGLTDDGKCSFEYTLSSKYKEDFTDFRVPIKCKLSEEGKKDAIADFRKYKAGNASIYHHHSDSEIIRKECLIDY